MPAVFGVTVSLILLEILGMSWSLTAVVEMSGNCPESGKCRQKSCRRKTVYSHHLISLTGAAHSHDKYLCQREIVSREMDVKRWPDGRPENINAVRLLLSLEA